MKVFNACPYERFIYVILWVMVWGYPLLTTIVMSMRGEKVLLWDSVLYDWAGIFPFFLLFLIHRLPMHFLFMRHRVRVYVFSAYAETLYIY